MVQGTLNMSESLRKDIHSRGWEDQCSSSIFPADIHLLNMPILPSTTRQVAITNSNVFPSIHRVVNVNVHLDAKVDKRVVDQVGKRVVAQVAGEMVLTTSWLRLEWSH